MEIKKLLEQVAAKYDGPSEDLVSVKSKMAAGIDYSNMHKRLQGFVAKALYESMSADKPVNVDSLVESIIDIFREEVGAEKKCPTELGEAESDGSDAQDKFALGDKDADALGDSLECKGEDKEPKLDDPMEAANEEDDLTSEINEILEGLDTEEEEQGETTQETIDGKIGKNDQEIYDLESLEEDVKNILDSLDMEDEKKPKAMTDNTMDGKIGKNDKEVYDLESQIDSMLENLLNEGGKSADAVPELPEEEEEEEEEDEETAEDAISLEDEVKEIIEALNDDIALEEEINGILDNLDMGDDADPEEELKDAANVDPDVADDGEEEEEEEDTIEAIVREILEGDSDDEDPLKRADEVVGEMMEQAQGGETRKDIEAQVKAILESKGVSVTPAKVRTLANAMVKHLLENIS